MGEVTLSTARWRCIPRQRQRGGVAPGPRRMGHRAEVGPAGATLASAATSTEGGAPGNGPLVPAPLTGGHTGRGVASAAGPKRRASAPRWRWEHGANGYGVGSATGVLALSIGRENRTPVLITAILGVADPSYFPLSSSLRRGRARRKHGPFNTLISPQCLLIHHAAGRGFAVPCAGRLPKMSQNVPVICSHARVSSATGSQ